MRIQNVIPYLINPDQSGCTKYRSTFNNIRSIYDVINYVNEKKGIISFIDYEKAFNTVNWNFLFDCLRAVNFGENLFLRLKHFIITSKQVSLIMDTTINFSNLLGAYARLSTLGSPLYTGC